MTNLLLHGDCLDILPTLEENSIDAIVTDPPYGLSFMGKDWDHGVPGVAFWREALRVAKPGAHLLAFGGSRTVHRLTCAIEDAGWEIRDTIMWVYSQGFPKSHNIGCRCTGSAVSYTHEQHKEGTKPQTERDVHSVRKADVSQAVDTGKGRREVLQPRLQEQGSPLQWAAHSIGKHEGRIESGMEGRRYLLAQAWELQADQVCEVSPGVSPDGTAGRLHHGASTDNGDAPGAILGTDGSGTSHQPRPARQPNRKSGTVSKQLGTQTGRGREEETCPKCGGLTNWQGWGTALKPAHEPIIMARKPFPGTVAQNVTTWGTGAINVDGGRVGTEDNRSRPPRSPNGIYGNGNGTNHTASESDPNGRWPANLIHDGSEEVLAGFPVTSSGGYPAAGGQRSHVATYGKPNERGRQQFTHSEGSAARFFYCAKASKADRDEGLEGFEERRTGAMAENLVNGQRLGGNGEPIKTPYRSNHHPTVKPTDLMRYLVRLVTPPDGIVLDPFMGSGSTGKAAILEGFGFVGIEREREYIDIAAARIGAAVEVEPLFREYTHG